LRAGRSAAADAPAPAAGQHAEQRERVDAEHGAADQRDHDRADADRTAPDPEAAATALAHVLDVRRLAVSFPSHSALLL
jgi:hypothetical protein